MHDILFQYEGVVKRNKETSFAQNDTIIIYVHVCVYLCMYAEKMFLERLPRK